MSYCRWSSDDFQCDVYTYESVSGGWYTHVAGMRYDFKEPLPGSVDFSDPDAWFKRYQEVNAIIDKSERVQIGLPHDGETFIDETPGDAAKRLLWLRGVGYTVPQYAIDELEREERERK